MSGNYITNTRPFRLKILSLLLNNAWVAKFGCSLIAPGYFEAKDEEDIAKAIIDYRAKYKSSPGYDDLLELTGGQYVDLIEELYGDGYDEDNRMASDIVVQFAREQAVKLAILESVDDINRGDLSSPVDRIKEALQVGETLLAPGMDPIADVDKWLFDSWENKIPTGWLHIDIILEGGLDVGEMGVILGPPNRGKTMALINIGYAAASIYGFGKHVVHFTHEMSVGKICKRYVARMLFRFPKPGDDLTEYSEEMYEAARQLLPGKIRVIGGARKMTTTELEGHLDKLVAEGFNPELVVDDYVDLLVPPRNYTDRRYELSALYEWYRSLGEVYDCPMWTASQGNRNSLGKELVTMADIAEDIGKANIADVIVAICQTYDEAQVDQ